MELLQLKYFRDAVITGNFSHTANKFFVPQSAVSQSIRRLEKELGTPLFDRTVNKIVPNECGKSFFNHVNAALTELEAGVGDIRKYSVGTNGRISILIENNRRFITDCIAAYKAKHPYVDFVVCHQQHDSADVHFDFIVTDRAVADTAYEKTPLITETVALSVSGTHRFANMRSVPLAALKNEPFISMQKGSSLHRMLLDVCAQGGFLPNITLFCDDPYYVRRYTAIGLGISLFPAFSWQGLAADGVSNIPLEDYTPQRITYLYSKKKASDAAVLFRAYTVLH